MEAVVLLFVILAVIGIVIWRVYQGAPYLASSKHAIAEMIDSAEWQGKRVAELGSGDGRLAMAIAAQGATVVGYEFNYALVMLARYRVRHAAMQERVEIRRENFWHSDLGSFDSVVVFGIPHMMRRLARKLVAECRPGTVVVSHAFPIPDLEMRSRTKRTFSYVVR